MWRLLALPYASTPGTPVPTMDASETTGKHDWKEPLWSAVVTNTAPD